MRYESKRNLGGLNNGKNVGTKARLKVDEESGSRKSNA